MAISITVLARDTINVPITLFHLFIELPKLYGINFCIQNKAFLRLMVFLVVTIAAIFLFFFANFINFIWSRLWGKHPCFWDPGFRFFISKIFSRPGLGFFGLKLTFLKAVLIDILGIDTKLESCFGHGIFRFFNQLFKTI